MKALTTLFLAGAVIASVGCSAKPSPEADISCTATEAVQYTGTTTGFIMVQKSVQMSDPALGGAVPANGLIATVVSPVASIQICEGDCVDGSGDFAQDKDIETDIDGLLVYTLGLDPNGPFSGAIIESFNAISQCKTDVTLELAGP